MDMIREGVFHDKRGNRELYPDRVGLYLHIPFCRHRCSYCDFNTYTSLGALQEEYADALCREIEQVGASAASNRGKLPVHTIYFGGGTPSLMSVAALSKILYAVRGAFDLHANAEISLEANPGTIEAPFPDLVREIGVNRLSIGVQSANPGELALLHREHDFAAVVKTIALCRQAGFDNVSLDLIYGLPGQTLASWQKTLDSVLALEPLHLSLYCLTIEPGTPMQRWLNSGVIQLPDPDLAAEQYELACAMLADSGFGHYEISNWAQPGYECQHNLVYWRNEPYLGLGAGAHGFAAGYRYHIVKQPRVYIRRMELGQSRDFPLSDAVAAAHQVGRKEAMSDMVMMTLRLLDEGLNLAAFEAQFGQSLDEAYDGLVTQLTEWGLLRQRDGRLLLSERGRFLSNQVFYRFM